MNYDELTSSLKSILGKPKPGPKKENPPTNTHITAHNKKTTTNTTINSTINSSTNSTTNIATNITTNSATAGVKERKLVPASVLQEDEDRLRELLDSALLDCYGRFITLLPESVLTDFNHLPFHLQEAHWWYIDKWVPKHPQLPSYSFVEFVQVLCRDCPLLSCFVTPSDVAGMVRSWKEYRRKIPVRGGIILNISCDRILMVQSYSSGSWSFPRGKIDEAEDDVKCALREIKEETSLDLGALINPKYFLELVDDSINIKLYLIPGVDEKAKLKSESNFEISNLQWVPLRRLENRGYLKYSTYNVKPFVGKILEFASDFKQGRFSADFGEAYRRFLETDVNYITFQISNNSSNSSSNGGSNNGSNGGNNGNNRRRKATTTSSTGKVTGGSKNEITFGTAQTHNPPKGWNVEDMFKVNFEKFGVKSTYNNNLNYYSTPLNTTTNSSSSNGGGGAGKGGVEERELEIFQNWTPIEIKSGRKYKQRDLVPFKMD